MKKPSLFAILLFVSSATFLSCNDSNDSVDRAQEVNEQKQDQRLNTIENQDTEFAVEAAESGMSEIEIGNLAKEKATHPEVKKMAERIVKDHTEANERLKAIASDKNITLPTMLSNTSLDKKNDLARETGSDFDKDYVEYLIDKHENDIEKFEEATNELRDPELNNFAMETLPILKLHLQHCRELKEKIK